MTLECARRKWTCAFLVTSSQPKEVSSSGLRTEKPSPWTCGPAERWMEDLARRTGGAIWIGRVLPHKTRIEGTDE
eukprot:8026768-Pyramimonas_sp.AAC.1